MNLDTTKGVSQIVTMSSAVQSMPLKGNLQDGVQNSSLSQPKLETAEVLPALGALAGHQIIVGEGADKELALCAVSVVETDVSNLSVALMAVVGGSWSLGKAAGNSFVLVSSSTRKEAEKKDEKKNDIKKEERKKNDVKKEFIKKADKKKKMMKKDIAKTDFIKKENVRSAEVHQNAAMPSGNPFYMKLN